MYISDFILFSYIQIFFETTYYETLYTSLDVPPWLEEEFSTTSTVIKGEPGPTIGAGDDTYAVFKIRFYDASSQELITDKSVLRQIVSMFIHTDEPYIYNEKRTANGSCFFYYNGILPANYSASMFTGFNCSETDVLNNPLEINRFYMKVQACTIPASFSDNLEKALDQF